MFNVSTLLLDDTFKPATPQTNGVINEMLRQLAPLSDISQGSVAAHLRCGRIFSDSIVANFLLILIVKQFWIFCLTFDKVKGYKNTVPIFGPPCVCTYRG